MGKLSDPEDRDWGCLKNLDHDVEAIDRGRREAVPSASRFFASSVVQSASRTALVHDMKYLGGLRRDGGRQCLAPCQASVD